MTRQTPTLARYLAHPAAFVLFVFAWTWSFWLTAIATGTGTDTPFGMLLATLGLLGPMIGGIGFTLFTQDRDGRRDYWRRLIDPRLIGARWYLVILVLVPALMGLTAALDLMTGGNFDAYAARFAEFFADPAAIPTTLIAVMLLGPLPEEFGWRGYLLDRLQSKAAPLRASLVLGFIWAVWHLPLFFLPGTYQFAQGAFGIWFWTFMAGIVPLSVAMTWIYNRTNRSILGMVLFHFVVVVVYNFLNATPGANVISTLLLVLLAIALVPGLKRVPIEAGRDLASRSGGAD
ncbi:MAG: CPBP family intramembrane metalloprotease [Alphaproteobacteria bacterium]|nr:CPBP family intramembrane metalloprotease [Alphaproteobacteria bacterium]